MLLRDTSKPGVCSTARQAPVGLLGSLTEECQDSHIINGQDTIYVAASVATAYVNPNNYVELSTAQTKGVNYNKLELIPTRTKQYRHS